MKSIYKETVVKELISSLTMLHRFIHIFILIFSKLNICFVKWIAYEFMEIELASSPVSLHGTELGLCFGGH